MNIHSPLVALFGAVLLLSGCVDLKPLQAEVASLKESVSRLESGQASLKTASESAAADARKANETAAAAQTAANQAASAAQASQACCDANSEKMERMFRRSVTK
jgi:outer membrane murein-binding lipoprotein Lpp